MGKPNPRRTNGHRRNQVRARVLAEEDICALCGMPVDKTLKTPDPGSPEVDEIVPVRDGGDPYDRSNCRLTHRRCNRYRHVDVKPAATVPLKTSRAW